MTDNKNTCGCDDSYCDTCYPDHPPMTRTVTIRNIKYQILERLDTEDTKDKCPLVYEDDKNRGITARLVVKRPNGKRTFLSYEFSRVLYNGEKVFRYAIVCKLPG